MTTFVVSLFMCHQKKVLSRQKYNLTIKKVVTVDYLNYLPIRTIDYCYLISEKFIS